MSIPRVFVVSVANPARLAAARYRQMTVKVAETAARASTGAVSGSTSIRISRPAVDSESGRVTDPGNGDHAHRPGHHVGLLGLGVGGDYVDVITRP